MNPSKDDVVTPEPVIFVPMYMAFATLNPPDNTTGAVPNAEASVVLVNVTVLFAAIVVNAPVLGLDDPMLEPVIVLVVNVSEPVNVANVPVVGNVTEVLPDAVKV